jgi:hypothetical protein
MGIFVTDQGKRSELQERLAAELRAKIANQDDSGKTGKSDLRLPDSPDGVDDSAYVKDFEKKFRPNGRIVGLLVAGVLLIAAMGLILVLAE